MDELLEILAEAMRHPVKGDEMNQYPPYRNYARRALAALHSRGLAVVNRQQFIDWIAEAEDRVNTIHSILRHRQQPQDVTFHIAQKALRDARNSLSARPSLKGEA